ncbi:MAG: VCBS repeat-containing protein [candidate division Zixibacteria bacterium]|nr:VCBS repeat-containing protein [candidate division Zixibacteria bacterium]
MLKYVVSIVILFSIAAYGDGSTLYVPDQVDGRIINQKREVQQKPEQLRSMVSQKNLLGIDRDKPFGLPKKTDGVPMASAYDHDTLNVLCLKVEFKTDSDPTTTGNGNIDLRTLDEFFEDEGHKFDPAPHNSSYFNAHMTALNRYWKNVSDGNVFLTWDIYPEDEAAAFRLPDSMAYYSGSGPWADSSVAEQLVHFVHDALKLADTTAPEIDFARYDAYLIFHAGADQQNNLYFVEDTPNDLWTGFLWTTDTIWVDDSTHAITEVTMMPETASQDNRVTVINSVMAHEFGHQLGLVDLYNTSCFLTTIGDFSLMDNNGASTVLELGEAGQYSALVSGVIPVYPEAWSRAYLGISGVREITNDTNIVISAAEQLHHDNEIVKVPISDMEYFLIENRQTRTDYRNSNTDTLYIRADSTTGVILGPEYGYRYGGELITFDSFEYDVLIPGDGMLIWHVDEAVAYMNHSGYGQNFLMNTLQWDPNRRFVSLVEADGIIDFGGNYVSWGYYGSDAEFFKVGNNTELTPSTQPNSRSNLGANTHISITDISASDTIMNCNISVDWHLPGFPMMCFPDVGFGNGGLMALDIDADDTLEILTARRNLILAVDYDGSSVLPSNYGLLLFNFDQDSLIFQIPRYAELDSNIAGNIIAFDFDGNGSLEIACFDSTNKLYVFDNRDINPIDSLADSLFAFAFDDTLKAGPIAYDYNESSIDGILAGFDNSVIYMIRMVDTDSIGVFMLDSLSGIPLNLAAADSTIFAVYDDAGSKYLYIGSYSPTLDSIPEHSSIALPSGEFKGLACGDINGDSISDAVITVGDYLCIYNGEPQSLDMVEIENVGQPSLGDINSDGYPDIALVGGNTYLTAYVFNHNGVLFEEFPVHIAEMDSVMTDTAEILLTEITRQQPILADVDNDHKPDIIIRTPIGGLTAINYQGDRLGNFPLATSTEISVEPVVGDFDGDADVEIAVLDAAGYISAWDLNAAAYEAIDHPWPTTSGDVSRAGYLSPDKSKEVVPHADFLSEGSVYNYPNPASNSTIFRYYVDEPANITISIYDMTGELVDELTSCAEGGTVADEIEWDCSEFASGIYFARVEAVAQNRSNNLLIKVALIK